MVKIHKRGKKFHVDYSQGRVRLVRGSLDTRDHSVALLIAHRLEIAIVEGPASTVWTELKPKLPSGTFDRFARVIGVHARHTTTWEELRKKFEAHKKQRLERGQLSERTCEHYERCFDGFELFLTDHPVSTLEGVDRPLIESYKDWRLSRIRRKNCTGTRVVSNELALLHHIFAFALDHELVPRNPVKFKRMPFDPNSGAQPFSADEVALMKAEAEQETLSLFPTRRNWLPFLLALRTGLRRADLVRLRWQDVNLERRRIQCLCRKNRKTPGIPILDDLFDALTAEFKSRDPLPGDTVLVNPKTGRPFEDDAYGRFVSKLGKRAGVDRAHPHRFRDTFAVDMLIRTNGDAYSVANLLGDTMQVVMKHYLPYVKELQQKVERLIRRSRGLEQFAKRRPTGKG